MTVLECITLIAVLIFGLDAYLTFKRYKYVNERDLRNSDNLERIADYVDSIIISDIDINIIADMINGKCYDDLRSEYGIYFVRNYCTFHDIAERLISLISEK